MASSLRKLILVPTGTASTWGTKAFPIWLMTLPRAGAGRGVSPLARLSQMTAPPGPGVPPPAIVPLTATGCARSRAKVGAMTGSPFEGAAADAPGAGGVVGLGEATLGGPPARARAATA